jgi:hyperosmotically inducible periplasmic protein
MRPTMFLDARSAIVAIAIVAALGGCSRQYVDDTVLTAKVKADLMKDDAAKASDIKVKTNAGVVQLSGFVGSEAARQRAEQLATSTEGVKSVRNDLSVQSKQESAGQYVADTAITAKVKAALLADDEVRGLAINVETLKGTVQLSGAAKSASARDKAEQLAKSVEGVTAVQNRIAVN